MLDGYHTRFTQAKGELCIAARGAKPSKGLFRQLARFKHNFYTKNWFYFNLQFECRKIY